MKTIAELFTHKNSQLLKLLSKAEKINDLNRIFHTMLEPHLALHCTLAKIKKNELVVVVENAAWATRLRYAAPDIIKNINTQPEFKNITTIKVKIKKSIAPESQKIKKNRLSPDNETIWKELLQSLGIKKIKN